MTTARWLNVDEQQAWRTMLNTHARLMAQLDAELQRDEGLTLPDYEVLVHLSGAPEHHMRMAELAEALKLSPSGLTRRIDGLVCEGLVERRVWPSDRRGSLAALTAKGWATLERAAPTHVRGVRAYLIDQLSRDELEALRVAMARISSALDAATCPGQCLEAAQGECDSPEELLG